MSNYNKKTGFECEHCGAHIGGEPYDFHQSLQMSKDAGWVSRKDSDGNWYKFCSRECAELWWAIEKE